MKSKKIILGVALILSFAQVTSLASNNLAPNNVSVEENITNNVVNSKKDNVVNNSKTENTIKAENSNSNTNNNSQNITNESVNSSNETTENIVSEDNAIEEQENEIETMNYQRTVTKAEKTKDNGIYKIAVGADSSKTIEIAGSDTGNNAKVDIWNYGNATAQKFYLSYDEEGFYKITAMHTGKSLTAIINNSTGTLDVVQYEYQGLDSQKWILRDSKKNGWVISSLSNPLISITVSGSVKNGAKLIMSDTKDSNNQMFYMYNITETEQTKDNGKYELLVGADSKKSIEVAGSNTANNAKVDIWDYGNVPAQKFNLQYENGYYKTIQENV